MSSKQGLIVGGTGTTGAVPVFQADGSVVWGTAIALQTLPVFNVKAAPYNAVGDGVANDTTAIQTAITDAAAGGIVFLPPGRYSVTGLTLSGNGITFMGVGLGDTSNGGFGSMLVGRNTMSSSVDVVLVSGSKCAIRQMNISGNGHGRDCLRLANTAGRFEGEDIYLQSAGSGNGLTHGTSVASLTAKWTNIWVDSCLSGYGILNNSSDTEWINVTTFSNGLDGWKQVGTAANIANVHAWGNTGLGLNLVGAGNRVLDGYLETNTGGGGAASGARQQLANVTCTSNGINGTTNPGFSFLSGSDYSKIDNFIATDTRSPKYQTYGLVVASGVTGISINGELPYAADNLTGGFSDAGTATSINGWITTKKAGDLQITSNAVIATDTDFNVPMGAGETWEGYGVLFVDAVQAEDFAVRLSPPTATGFYQILGPAASNASTSAASFLPIGGAMNTTQTVGGSGAGLITPVQVKTMFTVGGTGGTFNLKWAQGTSGGTGTILKAGSFMRWRRIA